MALLDYLHNKIKLIVVHINYHKRESAIRDQNIVIDYCKLNNIEYYIFDYKDNKKGNFQQQARNFRYECFKNICNKYNTNNILVAHQLEDHIETYLIQKQRKQIPNVYGLKETININGYNIIRPLLNINKKDILNYLNINNIKYGIDESNLETYYQRNNIRINKINKMNNKQINELLEEINKENNILDNKYNNAKKYISNNTIIYKDLVNYNDYQTLLRLLLNKYIDNISYKFIDELYRQLINTNKQIYYLNNILLINDKNNIIIKENNINYTYEFNEIKEINTEYFKITKYSDKFHSCTIEKKDYPITIRNYREGDSIKMRYGTKKVSRWFKDNHISEYDRLIWPIVVNSRQEIILIPQIGCSVNHYSNNPNLFVVKL